MHQHSSKILPLNSLCIICGPSKGGKTTFCESKFENYEIVNPEKIKFDILGDEHRNDINHFIWNEIYKRTALKLSLGERVVIDSNNLKKQNRINIANIAIRYGIPIFYIIVNRSLKDKIESSPRDKMVIEKQEGFFLENEKDILKGDGIAEVIDTRSQDFKVIKKFPLTNILSEVKERGFNGVTVIGDVHGCLQAMRQSIMWAMMRRNLIVFLGDIVDYGPNSLECIDEVYKTLTNGLAIMVFGNHERKIERWLEQVKQGQLKVKLSDGNKITTDAIEALTYQEREKFEVKFKTVLNLSRHHWVIGDAMFVHGAGLPEMWDLHSTRLYGRLENISLFGETNQEDPFKEDGYPNRIYNWIELIQKNKIIFVGHDIRQTEMPLVVQGMRGGQAVFMDTGSGKSVLGKAGRLHSADITFSEDGLPKIQNFVQN